MPTDLVDDARLRTETQLALPLLRSSLSPFLVRQFLLHLLLHLDVVSDALRFDPAKSVLAGNDVVVEGAAGAVVILDGFLADGTGIDDSLL